MEFSEYQKRAKETATYPERHRLVYPVIGLGGEAGEVLNKLQKLMRDKGMELTEEDRRGLALELGDVLWYVSAVASDLGFDLEEVASLNIAKLKSRMDRGVVGGSGDNR